MWGVPHSGGGQGVPYNQSYAYDAFGNMTGRSGVYYSYNNNPFSSDSGSYTNNRRSGWSYNADGQVTATTPSSTDNPRSMSYDAAGRMVTSSETGQFNTITYSAAYDGDGQEVYESSNTSPGSTESSYIVRATVLGAVLTRLDQSGNKKITHVPAEGLLFATQRTGGGNSVLATYRNPLGTTETSKAVYDPLGNYIPFQQFNDPRPPAGSYSSASFGALSGSLANPYGYATGCLVDGTPTNCSLARRLLNNGSAAQCPNNDCGPQARRVSMQDGSLYSFLTSPFMAFGNNVSGYFLPGWAEAGTPQAQAEAIFGGQPTAIDSKPGQSRLIINNFLSQNPGDLIRTQTPCETMAANAQQAMNTAWKRGHNRGDIFDYFDEEFSKLYVGQRVKNVFAATKLFLTPSLPNRTIGSYSLGEVDFRSEFREGGNHFVDQTHHFATYLSISINSFGGDGIAVLQRLHRARDNAADARLGKAGWALGQELYNNWDTMEHIGQVIRERICEPHNEVRP